MRRFFDAVWQKVDRWGVEAIFVLVLVVAGLSIALHINEANRWEAFKTEHNCVKVEHVAGDVGSSVELGVSANGQFGPVVVTRGTPDGTGWRCDDGVICWR